MDANEEKRQNVTKGVARLVALVVSLGCVAAVMLLNGRESETPRHSAVVHKQTGHGTAKACMQHLAAQFDSTDAGSNPSRALKLPWASRVALGFENSKGDAVVERDASPLKVVRVGQQEGRLRRTGVSHKWIDVGGELIFLYADNVVVTARTSSCDISGVFLPGVDGEIHGAVRAHVEDKMKLAQDKGCNKETKCGCSDQRLSWWEEKVLQRKATVYCEPRTRRRLPLIAINRIQDVSSQTRFKKNCEEGCKRSAKYKHAYTYKCGCGEACLPAC